MGFSAKDSREYFVKSIMSNYNGEFDELNKIIGVSEETYGELYDVCKKITDVNIGIVKHMDEDGRVFSVIEDQDLLAIKTIIDGFLSVHSIENIELFLLELKKLQPEGREWNDKRKHIGYKPENVDASKAYYNFDKLPEEYWNEIEKMYSK